VCGLVGLCLPEGGVEHGTIVTMRDALRHRGPDDAGLWISSDEKVGLGHRRLSIIDLSRTGRQPMCNEDRDVWLVFNGEIYNFRELRHELKTCGHNFRTRTDSEVIVHAYEEWGTNCLHRFNGIFAFAIWDERSRVLFAARDHLGVKPLYFWKGPKGMFAFASELRSLMLVPGFERRINLESLWWYLALRRVPAPRAMLAAPVWPLVITLFMTS